MPISLIDVSPPPDLLEAIYKTKTLTATRLAKRFFGTVDAENAIILFFFTLSRCGIKLKPEIDISVLGIKRVVVVIENLRIRKADVVRNFYKPGLHAITPLVPKGATLSIEGGKLKWDKLEDIAEKYSIRIYPYTKIHRARPLRDLLFPTALRLRADLIRNMYRMLLDDSNDALDKVPMAKSRKPPRMDWIDLEILDMIVQNPCIKIRKIINEYHKRISRKPLRHYSYRLKRLEFAVTGYGVSRIGSLYFNGYAMAFMLRGNNIKSVMRFLRVPITTGLAINEELGLVGVQLITLPKLFFETVQFMHEFADTRGFDVLDVLVWDHRYFLARGPMKKASGEYTPTFRVGPERWLEANVTEIVMDFIKHLRRNDALW